MEPFSYPALFISASKVSKSAQHVFHVCLAVNLVAMIGIPVVSAIPMSEKYVATLQIALLLVAFVAVVLLALKSPQQTWYHARALAESIKTMTWRFAMKAEPYQDNDNQASSLFANEMRTVLGDNKHIHLTSDTVNAIPGGLIETRNQKLGVRKELYLKGRIDDQLQWYRNKSQINSSRWKMWYGGVSAFYIVAGSVLLLETSEITHWGWSVDIVLAIAAAGMTWLQTKRFQELSASYALTMHEISILSALCGPVKTENAFSAFVGDAENAFSREHTQWRARRDVG